MHSPYSKISIKNRIFISKNTCIHKLFQLSLILTRIISHVNVLKLIDMKKKKLSKEYLRKKQLLDNKKFNKSMLISFTILFLIIFTILIFYTYRCDTLFFYRTRVLYGKEVPPELVCFSDNKMQYHETIQIEHNNKIFYICSNSCKHNLTSRFSKVALTLDAFSGDTIYKSNAIIGLEKKRNPKVVYFKNKVTFNQYYRKKDKR